MGWFSVQTGIALLCVLSGYDVHGLTGHTCYYTESAAYFVRTCDNWFCATTHVATRYKQINVVRCCTGWSLTDWNSCSIAVCTRSCKNGGTCTYPERCSCTPGYSGIDCSTPTCTTLCKNGGSCTAPDTCTCADGYTGPDCDQPICSSACQNNGTCDAPNTCTCVGNYTGTQCETPICTPACQNGGSCVSPDQCSCTRGYTGSDCATPILSTTTSTTERSTTGYVTTELSTGDLGCRDLHNCTAYGHDMCYDYYDWAKVNCQRTCGFCGTDMVTVECKNHIDDCDKYGKYMCTDETYFDWVESNCADYCGFCANKSDEYHVTTTVASTAIAPTICEDLAGHCSDYGGTAVCLEPSYSEWTKTNCPKYCGICYSLEHYDAVDLGTLSCPSWDLPKECTLEYKAESCCPMPQCPPDLRLTVKRQL